jgi:2-dehydro-3-deoxyphosphogluconate aldolase/(4S)-4-hydroxy-2-oxoglutarate aldolase
MARFNRMTVYNTMLQDSVVPLFYHGSLETSQQIAGALSRGGAHVLEFTNRGDFAIEVFSALVRHAVTAFPDLIIGVGTVDDAPTAALYIAHGANFVVGPTFNVEVARLCNRRKIAYVPGCGTASEIALAEEYGAEIVKLFPSDVYGPGFVKAIRGPRPWSSLMPTGGISPDEQSMQPWFDAGVAAVGMGSQLIRADWLKAGNFEALTAATEAGIRLAARLKTAR